MAELEATGPLSLPPENVRTLLAASATFQTLVGVASAAAAKAFIHFPAVDGEDWVRPRAVLGGEDEWEQEAAATLGLFIEKYPVWLNIEAEIPEAYQANTVEAKRNAHVWFGNLIGAILLEMEALVGPGYSDVRRFSSAGAMQRSSLQDEKRGEYWYGQFINVALRG